MLAANIILGKNAKEAFAVGLELLEGVDELPESYTGKNAGSLLHGMKSRFLKACNAGKQDHIDAAVAVGLIQESEDEHVEDSDELPEHFDREVPEDQQSEND